MLSNGNKYQAYTSFKEVPQFPYKIIEVFLTSDEEMVEKFWKLLKYVDVDALEKPNLTYEEKIDMIWNGDSVEQKYNIFLKPLVGSSLDTAEAQTQLRLYRYTISPNTQLEAVIAFEADFITNEKTCLVYQDGILCERTDLMETMFLDIINGRDIGIGSGVLTFNREMSRSCSSQLSIGNSKTFFGRSLVFALDFVDGQTGGLCG